MVAAATDKVSLEDELVSNTLIMIMIMIMKGADREKGRVYGSQIAILQST